MRIPRNARRPSASGAGHGPVPGALAALAGIGTLAAGALLYVLLGGASREPKPHTLHLYVLVDRSGSENRPTREQRFGALDEVIETTLPVQNTVTIWSYGSDTSKEWGPGRVVKSRDLWPVEDAISASTSAAPGTQLGRALEDVLAAAREAQSAGEPVACLVLGSGEETDHDATVQAARQLAALDNVKALWFAGAKPEGNLRTSIEQTLSPMGDRLVVSGPYDARPSLESFRQRVGR